MECRLYTYWGIKDRAYQMNFNPDKPRFDQSTLYGRLRHFAGITDPFIAFTPTSELLRAKSLMDKCRAGEKVPESLPELHRAQRLFQSAFHPDTGDLQNFAGRMCFNVWGGTMLCGAMMIWYKSTPAVVFWQWANQSFNALVNYTNRNAKSALTTQSVVLHKKMVPLAAVAVANAINIPLMRQNELKNGMSVTDADGNIVGTSQLAATKAISLVVLSRNIIVAPCMILTPIIMEGLCKLASFRRNINRLNIPTQLVLTFFLYGAMVPVGCALFPQQNSIKLTTLKRFEPVAYERLKHVKGERVYFNKGL
ncbi:tricarboxylate carrier [Ancylostoma ceylanicum]|uniref:Tricarboxylate carrier n=1 Tax=Ancylostoma ceylanicum TaxID=53326 RepID=A0A0D6LU48_9BILA|nr:tricarboxylate carrier [Ancylostoma ceylanicum]